MKIVRVTGVVYRQTIRHRPLVLARAKVARPHHYTVLVRVDTDVGLTGWGEAFGHFGVAATTLAALETLVAPLAIGADPADVESLSDRIERQLHPLGGSGPVAFARSGLDIALWDLRGKASGQPVHALLGGAQTASLPAYASLMRYGDAETVAAETAVAIERGYAAVKLHEVDDAPIEAAAGHTTRADLPLLVDVNCAWTLPEARAKARLLERLGAGWLEEPVWPPDDAAAMADLRRGTRVPIAAGENAQSPADCLRLIDSSGVDYIQPSITKIGGITAMARIARHASRLGVRLAPHSPYFGPGLVATLHVLAAFAPTALVEHLFYDMDAGPFDAVVNPQDGRFVVPEAPGLGAEPNMPVLAAARA